MNHSLLCFVPFLCYWGFCGILELLPKKLVKDSHVNLNTVEPKKVFIDVLYVTLLATLGNFVLYYFNILNTEKFRIFYIFLGIWWIDTVEYFVHFVIHRIPTLYKTIHKEHHRLHIPYHYGALYNSSYEAGITGNILTIGFILFGFSFYEFIFVTSLANIATILDHIDLKEYIDINSTSWLSVILKYINKNDFHYLHHSKYFQYNFQQPFFTYYDRLFGTYKVE
jgi:sterol desaturase/sphingolipid hydroxylase (fatty acid hydroxylase superfamily)